MPMRRSKCFILALLLLLATTLSAAEMVAKITAYNAAELSGEVPAGTTVSFENSNHSKGKLTADNTAQMVFSNLPKGALTKVVLYLNSNASSGAGFASVVLDNTMLGSLPQGSYAAWRETGYSVNYLPFAFEGLWQTSAGSTLTIEVGATENSIGWDRVEVSYILAQEQPRTITLQWFDVAGNRQEKKMSENAAGAGIILPDCEIKQLSSGDEWTFAGWTKEPLYDIYTSEPNYYLAGEKYYPNTGNETLYALYYVAPELPAIVQATEFQSGEYMLALLEPASYNVWSGEVEKKKLPTEPCVITKNTDGLYQFGQNHVPASYRYQLTFDADSVSVKYLLTGATVGHTDTYLSDRKVKWAWRESLNHSVELSYDRNESGNKPTAQVLWSTYEGNCINVTKMQTDFDFEYFILFEVSDVPVAKPHTKWTNYPFGTEAVENTSAVKPQVRKTLKNGTIYIDINHAEYDLLGNKYH